MDLHRILNDFQDEAKHTDVSAARPTVIEVESSSGSDSDSSDAKRVGKWLEEEERYALELVKQFTSGILDIPSGSSLRSLLAQRLSCSPMRVSTKLSMESLQGVRLPKKLGQKRYFPAKHVDASIKAEMDRRLQALERAFTRRVSLKPVDMSFAELMDSVCEISTVSEGLLSPLATIASGDAIRIGGWSQDEQRYTSALIDAFLRGQLSIPQGTTLRSFLSEQLSCNPMRVSKKLATGKIANRTIPKRIGSAAFQPTQYPDAVQAAQVEQELARLRNQCFPARRTLSVSPKRLLEDLQSPLASLPHPQALSSFPREASQSPPKKARSSTRPGN